MCKDASTIKLLCDVKHVALRAEMALIFVPIAEWQ